MIFRHHVESEGKEWKNEKLGLMWMWRRFVSICASAKLISRGRKWEKNRNKDRQTDRHRYKQNIHLMGNINRRDHVKVIVPLTLLILFSKDLTKHKKCNWRKKCLFVDHLRQLNRVDICCKILVCKLHECHHVILSNILPLVVILFLKHFLIYLFGIGRQQFSNWVQ